MIKVLVCGSRSYTNRIAVQLRMCQVLDTHGSFTLISGGARGPDMFAINFARLEYDAATFENRDTRIPYTIIYPDWETHGKKAGIMRNNAMLNLKPDLVIAFYDGISRGTAHTIAQAELRNIPVEIHYALHSQKN